MMPSSSPPSRRWAQFILSQDREEGRIKIQRLLSSRGRRCTRYTFPRRQSLHPLQKCSTGVSQRGFTKGRGGGKSWNGVDGRYGKRLDMFVEEGGRYNWLEDTIGICGEGGLISWYFSCVPMQREAAAMA